MVFPSNTGYHLIHRTGSIVHFATYFYEILYSTLVLYILKIIEIWVFLAKKLPQKPASQYYPGALAVLVRYTQAQKCLLYNPKCFQ